MCAHFHYMAILHFYVSLLPRPFQHSSPLPCLQQLYFFDVVAKMIDVCHKLHPNCTHSLGLIFILGRTLHVYTNMYHIASKETFKRENFH